ncbi:phosphoadenylyl-sulfate reductase [Egicoccus halophilus]|uniref:Adenosine 5'-phosphosulfate reductase n=1 Tax=Egicoccus halophilus TaxID=1670830 RepID=A0A8J3A6P7_9ACTN|nr:phosphoadenylyl-sulfate reductase [Egicoccus halophilus]GGI02656.1 phosphoadenosine phosphosulfate reductase [Egicoccus halophilus]
MNALRDDDRAAVGASVAAALDGARPRPDDRFRALGPDDDSAFIRLMAAEAAATLEDKPADRILEWAAGVVPRFVVTSSFGAESAVLLHLLSRVAPEVPVLFLDTGLHFDETLRFRADLARRLGLSVVDLRPERSVAQQALRHGDALWSRDPDACCAMRKTTPLRTALHSFDGWATGVRRSQTPERAATPVVEAREHDGRWLVKVAPLVTWDDDRVDAYLREHDLPHHPLADQGYPSIGCAPCTARVAPGQDPRAGRWAGFDGKTECGIHLADDGTVVRTTTTPG